MNIKYNKNLFEKKLLKIGKKRKKLIISIKQKNIIRI